MDIRCHRALQLGVDSAVTVALPFPLSFVHTASQPPKMVLVTKSLANESPPTTENGVRKYQKNYALEYSLLTDSIHDETDIAGQIRLVEQMIVARVDAPVLAPVDSRALVLVVEKAVDTGIFVISIDNKLGPAVLEGEELNALSVGSDSHKGARLVGDLVTKSLKSDDAVGTIEGIPTTTNAQQRTVGFKDTVEVARLKITEVQSGEWKTDKGNKVAITTLCSEPDLKALLCDSDNMVVGAISAVRMAGKLGKVLTGGYGSIDATKAMLADRRVAATAGQYADQQAVCGIKTALEALASEMPQTKLSGVVETPADPVARS